MGKVGKRDCAVDAARPRRLGRCWEGWDRLSGSGRALRSVRHGRVPGERAAVAFVMTHLARTGIEFHTFLFFLHLLEGVGFRDHFCYYRSGWTLPPAGPMAPASFPASG